MKWQDIGKIIGTIASASAIFLVTLLLNLSGMTYNIPPDQVCGPTCFSEVDVNTSYWNICFENAGVNNIIINKKSALGHALWVNLDRVTDMVPTIPEIKTYILVPTSRLNDTIYRDDKGTKWRYIKSGDCIDRSKKPNRLGIYGIKPKELTVKWGFVVGDSVTSFVKIDPVWEGTNKDNVVVWPNADVPGITTWKKRGNTSDPLSKYLDVEFTRYNETHWKVTFKLNATVKNQILDVLSDMQGRKDLAKKLFGSEDMVNILENIDKMPILSDGKKSAISLLGADKEIIIPEGKFGYGF